MKRQLKTGIYNPDLKSDNVSFVRNVENPLSENSVEQELAQKEILNNSDGTPVPLTEVEARAIEEETRLLLLEIDKTEQKIDFIERSIDEYIGEDFPSFEVKGNKALRQALAKALGISTGVIDYKAYKTALEAKRELQEREANAYLEAEWSK